MALVTFGTDIGVKSSANVAAKTRKVTYEQRSDGRLYLDGVKISMEAEAKVRKEIYDRENAGK